MKKVIITVVVLVLVVVVFLVFKKKPVAPVSGEPIKIGASLALTDFGASWAENELKGAKLAVKEINQNGGVLSKPLELISEDNQSQAKGSVSAVTKLISVDKVKFLLTGWSDQTEPIIPIITQNKVVTITVSAGATGITKGHPYLFRTWPSDAIAVKSLVQYSKNKGFKRVAVINSIGPWENTLADSFKVLALQNGIEVVDVVSFQPDLRDLKTQIAGLKAKNLDAVFIPMTTGPVERFIKQAGELGLNVPLLYPVDLVSIGVTEKVPVSALKNIVYAVYAPSAEKFVAAFKKEYGTEPGVSADTAYDSVYLLANAIKKAGSTDPEKVKDSFEPLDGASGQITFDQDRDRSDAKVILMGFNGTTNKPSPIK